MKIFVSYSQEIKDWISKLINELKNKIKNDNLDVEIIWDETHLKLGHDMHFFMENSIRKADKVFIFCDTSYTQKANKRNRGVGIETTIITPKMYGKVDQTKFIPVILWNCEIPDYLGGVYGIPIESREVTKNIIDKFYNIIQEMIRDKQENEGFSEKKNETNKEYTEMGLDVAEEKIKSLVENYMREHTATKEDIDALFPELNNKKLEEENHSKTNIGMPKVDVFFKSRESINYNKENKKRNNYENEKQKLIKGIVDDDVIYYITEILVKKDMLCKFIIKYGEDNLQDISNAILKLNNELQEKVMRNIKYNHSEATGYGNWGNYDYFGALSVFIHRGSNNEKIKEIAYNIIENCSRYRNQFYSVLKELDEEKYI